MSENEQLAAGLPAETLETILAAANCRTPFAPNVMAGLDRWLSEEWSRAIRRARTKPLTRADVELLDKAYREFLAVIDKLQDRTLPPPRIPMSNGTTEWDDWRAIYEAFGFIRGRRESCDWILIGALLALYETVTDKPASAAQTNGPTMRFLVSALAVLATQAPRDVRSNFAAPTANTLRHQLPSLRRLSLWHANRKLAKLIELAR